MMQDPTKSDAAEGVLEQFVADLERAPDAVKLVADYTQQHPQLSERLHEMARVIRVLDDRRWKYQESAPSQLGEFRIVREIPGGGMGRVYEAIQEPLGRRVAVKTIRGDCLSTQMRARFLREQTVLASLHQTHIVPIHMAGQSGDLQYFVMPYIEGVTLHQIIETVKRQQTLSPSTPTPTLAKLAAHSADSTILAGAGAATTLPTSHRAPAPVSQPRKLRLSMDYCRSIAKVMLDAAEAFHHVHGLQILHRDLKPSNLMVDTAGQCWIIDFGLAAYQHDGARPNDSSDGTRPDSVSAHLHHRLTMAEGHGPGTPSYMSPEQWRREPVDARTDVWGLGVTLYELLTLSQAFPGQSSHEIRRKVESNDPPPPHQIVSDMPRDLEAVCLKALKKDPSARYQTAQMLGADLRRWLNYEPVEARRTHVPRRLWLWARRNRGWATALAVFCLACAGAAAAEIRSERNRAAFAEAQEHAQLRESMLQQMQNVRLMPHQSAPEYHWLDDGWDRVRRAAQIRKDDVLRDQAAAFLAGVDGRIAKIITDLDASAVAFDADGRRVLIGGSAKDEARIWNSETDEMQKPGIIGAGPVTFRPDGIALQLVATGIDRFPLRLWDVSDGRLIRELSVPKEHPDGSADDFSVSRIAMTPDAKFVAASATTKSPAEVCVVWDAASGKVVRQIRQSGRHITAIAVSADGGLLAVGDAEGQVAVWPLPEGEPFVLPVASPTRLHCLAFGAHVHGPPSRDCADKWLLAGGDAGGSVTIWDLGRKAAVSFCRGSYYDIYALAFCPDGVTLASAGRDRTTLWDIASGRALLQLARGDYMTGLAFSRDGRKVAVSMEQSSVNHGSPGAVIWELEPHRGVQTLRGLTSQIANTKVCFTRDGNKIAAVSLDWRVGIWDLPSGVLHYRFAVAPGLTADNTGLAFSPNGRQFAVSAGSEARLWDLESGKETVWKLPNGLVDTLVFDATGTRLFLFRMETSDWNHPPDSTSSYRQFPRVCRVRDLLASPERDLSRPGKNNPTWETDYFNAGIAYAWASSDGRYFVTRGDHEAHQRERMVKAFDCATGKEVFSMPGGEVRLDATGQLIEFGPQSPGPASLIELSSGRLLGYVDPPAGALGPGARLSTVDTASGFGYALYRRGERIPLVTLGIDTMCSPGSTFSSDGSRLAWGNRDGTVTVCYLAEVQRRLADMGLGW